MKSFGCAKNYNPPVFLVGFQRGGTNILLNILLSHPKLVAVRGEFHELFLGTHISNPFEKAHRIILTRFLSFSYGKDFYSLRLEKEPAPFSVMVSNYIKKIMQIEPLKAKTEAQNKYIDHSIMYTKKEILSGYPVCKLMHGHAYLTRNLRNIFPNSRFAALVRDGFALCEGQKRRNIPIEKAAHRYNDVCTKMREDEDRYTNYKIFKFEDLICNTIKSAKDIYFFLGLERKSLDRFRLQSKHVSTPDNSLPDEVREDREVIWYDRRAVNRHFVVDVNKYQTSNLNAKDISTIKRIAGNNLRYFGYL